jgi:hypothetical protein
MKFCKVFHNLTNGKIKVAKGQIKKPIKKTVSKIIRPAKRTRSAKINRLLIAIPIKIENLTKPSLYSFFQGLKKVFSIKGREKTPKNVLSKDMKKEKSNLGASKYQNFRISNGNANIFCIGSTISVGILEANCN